MPVVVVAEACLAPSLSPVSSLNQLEDGAEAFADSFSSPPAQPTRNVDSSQIQLLFARLLLYPLLREPQQDPRAVSPVLT